MLTCGIGTHFRVSYGSKALILLYRGYDVSVGLKLWPPAWLTLVNEATKLIRTQLNISFFLSVWVSPRLFSLSALAQKLFLRNLIRVRPLPGPN